MMNDDSSISWYDDIIYEIFWIPKTMRCLYEGKICWNEMKRRKCEDGD